ncbi:PadR family transcriptional regulator [Georgenia sp. SUBG003]|uniref:PadR family transcriptional regulator n=1 Tax=Georgenia sp. SUBG003 TaxID=1497974 RepID=UPI003AB7619B
MCGLLSLVLSRLILGLLALAPMTGYDIKRHLDSTVRHFWAADKAQVYRALASLVKDGYATVEVVHQETRPDRQEHHITEAGRAALHEWLASPLSVPAERDLLARASSPASSVGMRCSTSWPSGGPTPSSCSPRSPPCSARSG